MAEKCRTCAYSAFTIRTTRVDKAVETRSEAILGEAPEQDIDLTILMPCLNEASTLPVCVQKAKEFLSKSGLDGEILIADNGSTDGSLDIARGLGARVVEVVERGYGAALMGGILEARGRHVVMGDADDSYDFSRLGPFVERLNEGYALVMGDRFAGGIEPGAMPWLHRHLGNPVLSWIGRLFFHSPVRDFHCGMRAFSRDAILSLDLRTSGMEFASEMVVKATLHGLRITEVPTTLSPDGRSRPPHLRSWRDGWRHLRFLLLYSPRWLFLYPGLVLMAIGLAVSLWLLPGPRTVSLVTFDVHTLVFAALAVLTGAQAIIFAVLTKRFAISEGLLPEDAKMRPFFRVFRLEVGLVGGGLLVLGGLLASTYAFQLWQSGYFGNLDPVRMLRVVIPGATAIALGVQIVLASFFLSVLELKRR